MSCIFTFRSASARLTGERLGAVALVGCGDTSVSTEDSCAAASCIVAFSAPARLAAAGFRFSSSSPEEDKK